MAANNVMHGALALVKRHGSVIGLMRNVRWSETTRRQEVQGLGSLLIKQLPAVQHGGTISCDFYEIDFKAGGVPDAIRRDVQTEQEFEDNVLLEDGVTLDIFKKVEDVIDPDTQKKRARLDPYAIIRNCFIETDGGDITEGTISGRNQTFRYLSPVIYPQ